MAKMFAEHNGLDLTEVNNQILKEWEKNDIFHRSITERDGNPQFVFFEGPPSANGHPGIHHVLGRALKDRGRGYPRELQGLARDIGRGFHHLAVLPRIRRRG